MICFDKTGTLTHDGLDIEGVVPVVVSGDDAARNLAEGKASTEDEAVLPVLGNLTSAGAENNQGLLWATVTCHSLVLVNGEVLGDPLDLVMFQSSSWKLCDRVEVPGMSSCYPVSRVVMSPDDDCALSIVHQFPFMSALQRMSVIVEDLTNDNQLYCYMKGAPEMVVRFCLPSTGMPLE